MKATPVPIDSSVLGGAVLAVEEFDAQADWRGFEAAYVREHDPVYVSCKLPMEQIAGAHRLEAAGFGFIECQIRSAINLRTSFDIPDLPYEFAKVSSDAELEAVLDIAGHTFTRDRFSVDPLIPAGVSGERYRRYLRHSFAADDEAVFRLFDPKTNNTVAFKSHRYLPGDEVLMLQGGVSEEHQQRGLGAVNSLRELKVLQQLGIRRGVTHISAANYPVFNLEYGKLGFKALAAYAVLRKLYRPIEFLAAR